MTTQNTVTRATVLTHILDAETFLSVEERDVLNKMLASITKPRKASNEPTKNQLMNQNLAAELVAAVRANGEPVTIKWIVDHVNGINTPQKAVAIVRAAGEDLVKFYEGRQVYYRAA